MKKDLKMIFGITGGAIVLYLLAQAKSSLGAAPAAPAMTKSQALQLVSKYQTNPHSLNVSEFGQLQQANDLLTTDKRSILQRMATSDVARAGTMYYKAGYLTPFSPNYVGVGPNILTQKQATLMHEGLYNPHPNGALIFDSQRNTWVPVTGNNVLTPLHYPSGA